MVELYLTTEVSYQELALSVGINNPTLIARWVNDYKNAGTDALKPKQRRLKVAKHKIVKNNENINIDTSKLKELQDKNLKLSIENAYLKEFRRLGLEEMEQKRKQESSTVSEEYSD